MGLFKRYKKSNMWESKEKSDSNKKIPNEIEMTIDSIRAGQNFIDSSVPAEAHPRVLVLKEIHGDRYIPIWIEPHEADNIAVRLQGVAVPRPLTHDFALNIILSTGATVESILISKFENDCWYAVTRLNCDGQLKEIDCRPSDAIALAVRAGVPIFATKGVLEKGAVTADQNRKGKAPNEFPSTPESA
jgi:bifunctional DNase/RNase